MTATDNDFKTGPIWELLDKIKNRAEISEIVINGDRKIFAEVKGQFTELNTTLSSTDIEKFCQDLILIKNPNDLAQSILKRRTLDLSLDDGSRVHVVFPPHTPKGAAISIRRFNHSITSLDEHGHLFGIESDWIAFFKALVRSKMNLIVCGGTGSGKTTFLNLLLEAILPHERAIIIEDTIELKLSLPNHVRMLATSPLDQDQGDQVMSMRDLVKSSLRMRPDRLVIGEIRGEEAFDLLMAWNTGHEGSFTSLHANSPLEGLQRLESLFMLAGTGISLVATRKMIMNAVDFVLFIQKDKKGARRVTNILEVSGMEGPTLLTQSIAALKNGSLTLTGMTSTRIARLHEDGGLPKDFFQGKV